MHFCFRLRYEKNWRLQKVKGHDRNIGVGCITYIHTLKQTHSSNYIIIGLLHFVSVCVCVCVCVCVAQQSSVQSQLSSNQESAQNAKQALSSAEREVEECDAEKDKCNQAKSDLDTQL